MLEQYLKECTLTSQRGDAREESYYKHLDELIKKFADLHKIKSIDITILPKKTEAGNPDFRIWDGRNHITGYIEAKDPSVSNLDYIEDSEQLKRYRSIFPNVILTNFYEFRLYRDGERMAQVMIGRPVIAQKLRTAPPVENIEKFKELFELFFSFSLPKVRNARQLAVELAKRTRFLADEVIAVELAENSNKGRRQIHAFYEAFKNFLISTISEKQFADLYAQTITYGLFAARTRVPHADGEFSRKLAFDYIPHTIGILRDVFRYISLEEPPKSLQLIVEDISEILHVTDVNKILHEYYRSGKGRDPIIHFYETFLATYDPDIRERRGVYYTPESVVGYIVRSIHSLLKSHFDLVDGLASSEVKLLDPAGGTLTFIAEAIRQAADEFREKYGAGGMRQWIRDHILENYYAFELMMAPYAIGHLKMAFIFEELGYKLADDERFKLYLTNTLEMEEIEQIALPGLSSISEESHLAGVLKREQPLLVILGNPPYSGMSANINDWTEKLLKEDLDGAQSYYKVDGEPLGEKNPKWLQDDYVKFLRFAQWKIQQSGQGIVGMITNHSYLDNPTFRGMRQSLMKTFDEIYVLDLHGNSLKKETTPEGGKDENVFDIRQGVAIVLFVKNVKGKQAKIFHHDLFGLRKEKYNWLNSHKFSGKNYSQINPQSPYYFLIKRDTGKIKRYLKWKKINEIFPINSVGIVTSRDQFAIDFNKRDLMNSILQFRNLSQPDEIIAQAFNLKNKKNWKIDEARKELYELDDWKDFFREILYRPFDERYVFYHSSIIERMRYDVMRHFTDGNIGLAVGRQGQVVGAEHLWNLVFISRHIIDLNLFYRGGELLFPLYIYPEKKARNPKTGSTIMIVFDDAETYGKKPNIAPAIFEKLAAKYGKKPSPEEILHYVYGVLHSNNYRRLYAEFLKIDFPRIPFTSNSGLFKSVGNFGKQLIALHLLEKAAVDPPVAKYPQEGENDTIEKISYDEDDRSVYINNEKYFEGIAPDVWNYHIGGYQVLHKYLKDRKGRKMHDVQRYCRIVTALSKTIE
ncbi:N-6 DNA methylase, partial [candidate division KSB1 bacterium]|nr:N-6 DNA methylase [candidate division KSB1 bacterium]